VNLWGLHLSDVAVTAFATLLGVLTGALVSGLVSYWLERRRDRTQARAAARLLRMEFALRKDQLESAIRELVWWPFYDFELEPWDRYKALLAAELGADGWVKVSQSASELQSVGRGMLKAPAEDLPQGMLRQIGVEGAKSMLVMRANAVEAFNVLSELADDPEVLSSDSPPVVGGAPFQMPPASRPSS